MILLSQRGDANNNNNQPTKENTMRYIIHIDNDLVATAYSDNGHSVSSGSLQTYELRFAAALDKAAHEHGPGTYRAKVHSQAFGPHNIKRFASLTVGKRVDPKTEGERLLAKGGGGYHGGYRHPAPGISGNQQVENLVNASICATRHRNTTLGKRCVAIAEKS